MLAASVASAALRRTLVERIRYIGTANYSRVVIDLSAPVEYTILAVPGDGDTTPVARLVVDFKGASLGPEARDPLTVGDALLQRIRTGQYTTATARVVLDFRERAEHRVFTLPDPWRLVIDMRGPGAVPGALETAVRRLDSARPQPAGKRAAAASPSGSPGGSGVTVRPVVQSVPASAVEPATTLAALPPDAAAPSARPLRVVIDPGHGGKDPGARGVGGIFEKDVVLAISLELAARLRRERGVEVLLTRDDDRFLSLEERTAIANAAGADLFLSIHGNASPHRSRRGIEIYYLNNTNNRGTLRLAAMENGLRWDPEDRSLQEHIPNLSYILSDLRQTYKVEESRALADRVGGSIVDRLRGAFDGVARHEVHEGPFYVLVGAYMPCVLVEVSYLTHPVEGRRLASGKYRDALADGILEGIRSYLRDTRVAKNL